MKNKKEILTQFAQLDVYADELIKDKDGLNDLLKSLLKTKNNCTDEALYKDCLKKIDKLNIKIEQQIDKLCDLKLRIFTSINELDSIAERTVLWLHYIGKIKNERYNRLTLWQIGQELGYSEVRIKQLHKSALEKLKL